MEFKRFLLKEQNNYFGKKIGNVLTGIHELLMGGKEVGARQLIDYSTDIVTQIRKILHTSWPRSNRKYLLLLQKCGVAIMKSIDEKGDLRDTLNSVRAEIEKVLEKLGVPINNLASPEEPSDVEGEELDLQKEVPPQAPQNPIMGQ